MKKMQLSDIELETMRIVFTADHEKLLRVYLLFRLEELAGKVRYINRTRDYKAIMQVVDYFLEM